MQDTQRRPLDRDRLQRALRELAIHDVAVDVHTQVASTNDAVARPSGGWALCTADEQVAGRGRLGRHWASPPAAGVAMSLWLPLTQVRCPLTALPLVTGLAVLDALGSVGVTAALKWPNDVLFRDRKLGGILSQLHPDGAVLGIGINTHLTEAELPTPLAVSLAMAGVGVVREQLIAQIVAALRRRVAESRGWCGDYRDRCATLGRDVEVELTGGTKLHGRCTDITDEGALVVLVGSGTRIVTVGDVHHVRDAQAHAEDVTG